MESRQLKLYLWGAALTYLVVQTKALDMCEMDSNCTASNTVCVSGVCQCHPGFTFLNGQCNQVLGRTCLDNLDCDDGRTVCTNSKCQCMSRDWREFNGRCASYYGETCDTWTNCGLSPRYKCTDKLCKCNDGYKYTNDACEKVLGSYCNLNKSHVDCPLDNALCRVQYYWGGMRCQCSEGYTENDDQCIQVLGSSCEDVKCGNPLHFSYEYLSTIWDYFDYWGYNYYHWSYHLHLSCNIDNVCACDHGFVADGSACVPAIGRWCLKNGDCGNYPGYSCDENNTCTCSAGFQPRITYWSYNENRTEHSDYFGYDWYGTDVTLCIPVIGQSCDDVICSVMNSNCSENNTCLCNYGYTETNTGLCEKVLGMSCLRDTLCQIVNGGTCGRDNICVCKDGFTQNGIHCQQVLGSSCSVDDHCQLENSVCVSESCTCSSGFEKFESRCLRADCAVHVQVLPDLHRRSVNHVSVKNEPVIDDVLLAEDWYSIGKYDIHVSQTDPDKGHCSAYYPIYLKGSLALSQLELMKTGNVSVSATIGGLEYGESENVGITLRKCGEDTQIFFQPPKTHFAGLCLSDDRVHSVTRSSGMFALVVPDLLFAETHENNRTKHSPYVVFSCLPSEFMAKTTRTLYPHSAFHDDNDIFFYYVHWYINEVHFKSKGPVRRRNFVTKTSLFEDDILDSGFALGFKIRCSFEIAESPNGVKTLIATSDDFLTGFKETSVTLDKYTKYNLLHISSDTPLGCESFDNDSARHCEIEWPIVNEQENLDCNITERGQNGIKACSFSMQGFTKAEYSTFYYSWQYEWQRYYRHTYFRNETHLIDLYEYLGTHIDITNSSKEMDFRIKFNAATQSTGHKLWDGYKMPQIQVKEESPVQEICNITMLTVPVITIDLLSQDVLIDIIGEFILYRSRSNPVEIHIQSEACTSNIGEICVCGVTYRNGDNIYTFNYCNGFTRIGQIYGDPKNQDDKDVLLINGMALTIYARDGKITALGLNSNHSKETLEEGKGLCTFSSGIFKYRNGTALSASGGFVTSWRISEDESLLNPKNHRLFAWKDDYSLCYCPLDAKDREILYHYNSTNDYNNDITFISETANNYRGYFRCSDDNFCSESHEGEEWPESASPSFSNIKVKSRMEIRYQGVSPLLHVFCDFEKQNGFLYRIQWNLDGDEIYKSDVMSGPKADGFFINNHNFTTTKFLLESGFSCVVSVYNDSQSKLFEARSEEIRAFDIVRTELLLPRGGDTTIQLKINIPFVCPKGTPCHFDFKLFDPSESHNCSDSTIAIKDQNTCGKRIIGVHSESELDNNKATVVNITLTTKNNDLYTLRNTFTLRLKFVTNGATSTFQECTFSKQITVFVRDDERYWQSNYCYANNDPRMRTFDGQYYSNMLVDEFVMMKHKRLPVEVQLETFNGWYSCGVTVRAGRDVFTINHCHGDHVTGYLLADDKILKVKKRDEHRYQIYLPHGTMIDVMISSWAAYMVNVYIYPSPADMKQVEGLCGDFDGNIKGDLIHSDGKVTHADDYYWWWWYISDPNDFIRSWGLGSTNSTNRSLTDIEAIEETLESWFVNDVLCVCTGNDGNGEVKCSANEQNTCVTPVDKPGDDVSIVVRQKRSGHVLEKEYKQRMRKMKERREANRNSETHNIRPRSIGNVQDAIDSCNLTLSSSCGIMSVKDDGLNVTFEELVYNCGQDRAASPDTDWTALTCQVMEANVEKELRVDVEFKEKHPELVSEILQNLCVGNCSGNGKCVQGTCECFAGYKASDCSLDLSKRVVIKRITGDGVCDVTKYDCTCLRLTTSGSLSTSTFTLEHKQFDTSGVWNTKGTSNGTVVYDNFNEVFVCPNVKRTKRSVDETSVIADQYVIALSNDNTRFGDSSTVFVMDSTCLNVTLIDGAHNIELLPGFCIIGGVCYRSNTQSPSDSCLICVESANPYHWSRDDIDSCKDAQKVNGEDTTGIQPYLMGIIAGAAGFVVVVVVVVVAVCIVKKKLATRVGAFEGQLYDTPKNTEFQQYPLRKDGKTA